MYGDKDRYTMESVSYKEDILEPLFSKAVQVNDSNSAVPPSRDDEVTIDIADSEDQVEAPKSRSRLEEYADHILLSPPGVYCRAFLNDNPSKKNNFGVEITLTSYDIPTLSYQCYRVFDLLGKDMAPKDVISIKGCLDDCVMQIKENSIILSEKNEWQPYTPAPI